MQLPGEGGPPGSVPKEPDVLTVTFGKVHGSMGLSIVAAKVNDYFILNLAITCSQLAD